ncbi:MAG: ABC transporter substrate-binding protein [Oscillospiraceae bacterium]|nr:ABC transporter substrate-binding protein [Oscillospiraceae bacterium]
MKKMCKFLALLLVVTFAAASFSACENGGGSDDGNFSIGIIQLLEHPALDAASNGFMEELTAAAESAGYTVTFDLQNAQNDTATLNTIASGFERRGVDLVLANATPSAQAMANVTNEIPIVGVSITTFVGAGLVDSNEAPGGNITGASDMNPVRAQIEMILEFFPDIQTIGLLYSSGEDNSVYQAQLARDVIEDLGLTSDSATIADVNDLRQVATSLAGRVDAIYIPTDNNIAGAMGVIEQVSDSSSTPFFAGEENMTMGGGVATLSVNYEELGRQAGRMAAQILLQGATPATMPIQTAERYNYTVNGYMVERLGIDVPTRFQEFIRMPE